MFHGPCLYLCWLKKQRRILSRRQTRPDFPLKLTTLTNVPGTDQRNKREEPINSLSVILQKVLHVLAYMPSQQFSGGFNVCHNMFKWGVRRDYLKRKNKAYFKKKKIIEVYLQWCIQEWCGLCKHNMHGHLLC